MANTMTAKQFERCSAGNTEALLVLKMIKKKLPRKGSFAYKETPFSGLFTYLNPIPKPAKSILDTHLPKP